MRGFAAGLTLGLLLLAGCSSSNATKGNDAEEPLSTVSISDDAGDETGSIVGSVMDDEENPLEGATVGIVGLGDEAITDVGGGFAFVKVPPGEYAVAATKLGYKQASEKVSVSAGVESPAFVLRLEPLASFRPWYDVETHDGQLDWGARVVACPAPPQVCVGQGYAAGDIVFTWETEEIGSELTGMVAELHWRGTQTLAKAMRMRVEVEGRDNDVPKSFVIAEGASPIVREVNETRIKEILALEDGRCMPDEQCGIQWRVFTGTGNTGQSVDVGLTLDQRFTGYVTHFYRMAAPEGFTAAPTS